MASKNTRAKQERDRNRKVQYAQFVEQLEETGVTNTEKIWLDGDDYITIRLGNGIDAEPDDDFEDRLEDADDSREAVMIILDYDPDPERTADMQWELFEKHGGTADRLMLLFTALTREQNEKLLKTKVRRR